jgi:hypothetical protein
MRQEKGHEVSTIKGNSSRQPSDIRPPQLLRRTGGATKVSYAREREREENLRAQRRVIIDHLSVMNPDDPAVLEFEKRLRGVIHQLRQIHLDRAVNPCSDLECIEAGTVMENGKPWCPIHLPTHT